ncbi:MAG: DUF177 domain-containing protein [Rhodobiaceae bacterium]|nr:DUF177 domain-containing protein [Rhodobiaceae bacterium]
MTKTQEHAGRHERISAFDAVVPVSVIPRAGLQVTFTASAQELDRLKDDLGLARADAVSAELEIRHWRKGGVVVSGRVQAELSQVCVVTLEPVPARVDEDVLLRFVPEETLEEASASVAESEAEDLEVLPDGVVQVGAIVRDTVVLALDPYPRAPGAELPDAARDDDATASPFSVLEKLKPGR